MELASQSLIGPNNIIFLNVYLLICSVANDIWLNFLRHVNTGLIQKYWVASFTLAVSISYAHVEVPTVGAPFFHDACFLKAKNLSQPSSQYCLSLLPHLLFLTHFKAYLSLNLFARFHKDMQVKSLKCLFFKKYVILLGVQICIFKKNSWRPIASSWNVTSSVCQEWQKSIFYNNWLLLIDSTQLKMCVSEA